MLDDIDIKTLSDWDLPAYLRAVARVQAWMAALMAEAVAELAGREGGFGADKEVALALREPVGAAQRRVHYAKRLRRLLPETRRRFLRGDLPEKHVDAMIEATDGVNDPALVSAVEDRVLNAPGAMGKTARELQRHARRTLTRLDPAGAQDRARAAREQADVTLYPGEDGMSTVVVDAPVEQALPVKSAADAYAATAKAGGDPRRIGVLRAEGLARICTDYLAGLTTTAAGTAPRAGGRPIEIGIVIGMDTALGRRDLPGEVPGHGIVPREVIAEMIATAIARRFERRSENRAAAALGRCRECVSEANAERSNGRAAERDRATHRPRNAVPGRADAGRQPHPQRPGLAQRSHTAATVRHRR